ncbi:MAG TPA: histidine kinase [Edaphocola sp.]|nr:histidine kinase [Edaphocola sp.]
MENEIIIQSAFWVGTALMLLAIFSILMILVFYHRFRSVQKQKEAELLLNTAIESEKKERLRIARDLHDDISGDLNAIANYLTIIKKISSDIEVKEIAQESAVAIRKTLSNVQFISYNLMPPQLEISGFIPAIRDYFKRIQKWNNIKIDLIYDKDEIPIKVSYKYELFRIVQELFNNMQKHGKVSQCTIEIKIVNHKTIILIIDNGLPFDFYKMYSSSSGLGLKNIISRVKHINAELKQQHTENGNSIILNIPNTSDD